MPEDMAEPKTITVHVIDLDVSLDKTELHMDYNSTDKLTATVTSENAPNKGVTWTSSDRSVVYVGQSGQLKSYGKWGEAIITATSKINNSVLATCKVTVGQEEPLSISLDKTDIHMDYNSTDKLTATVTPENAPDKGVIWTSSNKSVVYVGGSGQLKSYGKYGEAIITATSKADNSVVKTCKVTVGKEEPLSISLDKTSISMAVNSTDKLTATILPASAPDKGVTWTSSNKSLVYVGQSGQLKSYGKKGMALITVTSKADPSAFAYCIVNVE